MAQRTIVGLRWWIIGLVLLGGVVNFLTRSSLSVAAPVLITDLNMTTVTYGWVTAAFQAAIMLQPLCGMVIDTIGLRFGLGLFAIAWSLICMAHGLATNWQGL